MIRIPRRLVRGRRAVARAGGFFWLPCPCCGRDFGGFETGRRDIRENRNDGVSVSWMCCRWCDSCPGAERERLALAGVIDVPPDLNVKYVMWEPTPDEWRCRS